MNEVIPSLKQIFQLLKMFSHTSASIAESRNRVGGEGTFVLAGATG